MDEDYEKHLLIIKRTEISNLDEPTEYIYEAIAKFANKLGKSKLTVKKINYDSIWQLDDLFIEFFCEHW